MLMVNNPEAVAGRFLYPYIRFFNASPGSSSLSFAFNDSTTATQPYATFSRYIQTEAGLPTISVYDTQGNMLDRIALSLDGGQVYTIAAIGKFPDTHLLIIPEPTAQNKLNVSNLRIANLSPDVPDVDIFANGFPILQDIEYPEISRYIYLKPNHYTYRVNPENSNDVLLTIPGQTANVGQYYTLYLVGEANGTQPLSATISLDAASYTGQYL
ncbi:MAG: DUF4397 domain-containing protein [Ruminococcaceae bacterium]|nr:DUF4397 domain-containing protein [Oscillospiraceae bacterium]